jgi:hypothetical protein
MASVIASGILNGFPGLIASFLALPAMICLAIYSTRGGPLGGLGTAIAFAVGSILVAGLLEIIVPGLGTKVFGVCCGFWDWLWGGGYWLTGGILSGSFIVAMLIGAKSET